MTASQIACLTTDDLYNLSKVAAACCDNYAISTKKTNSHQRTSRMSRYWPDQSKKDTNQLSRLTWAPVHLVNLRN